MRAEVLVDTNSLKQVEGELSRQKEQQPTALGQEGVCMRQIAEERGVRQGCRGELGPGLWTLQARGGFWSLALKLKEAVEGSLTGE